MIDGRLQRGERTRQAVLDTAVRLASVEGLDGLSLARLAQTLGVSKSGLFTHWPDKQALQLAIVEQARQQWVEQIIEPALRAPGRVRKLWALHEHRLAFYASAQLPGGCFFRAVDGEFDDRPGPVHDAIAAAVDSWMDLLTRLAGRAVELGELRPGTDPGLLAFEIEALGAAVVVHTHLLHHEHSHRYARRAVLDRLRALATDPSILPEA
ncbi:MULTISPECIES: TetR/AcrR family transcriptional regulator [Streptosporangium]|uniref:AcrR family transcriptional regulator n=1 Tax=Streptosporangium brasiliense TaxID=47480 RepID=A0ABT9RES4_9ACTN|nr:TetR/AcrR family transcriptional regulator [Streptosporangium brasiliense]MDP9866885.1 AcrR family transcriptional regulator [Streptosporangium brasiliense]